jgi:hypothetical protein
VLAARRDAEERIWACGINDRDSRRGRSSVEAPVAEHLVYLIAPDQSRFGLRSRRLDDSAVSDELGGVQRPPANADVLHGVGGRVREAVLLRSCDSPQGSVPVTF